MLEALESRNEDLRAQVEALKENENRLLQSFQESKDSSAAELANLHQKAMDEVQKQLEQSSVERLNNGMEDSRSKYSADIAELMAKGEELKKQLAFVKKKNKSSTVLKQPIYQILPTERQKQWI